MLLPCYALFGGAACMCTCLVLLLSLSYHLGCGVYTGSRCYLLQQRRDREAGDALTFAYVAPRADWLTAANLTVDTRRMT